MSIQGVFLAATTLPATAPTVGDALKQLAWLVGFTLLSIVLMIRTGVLRPRNIVSPERIHRRGMAGGLFLVLILGLCVWIFAQAFYSSMIVARWQAAGHKGPIDPSQIFSPHDFAILSTVPPMLGFAVLLFGGLFVGSDVPASLGLAPRRVGWGLLLGILGIFIVGPWVLWSGLISEFLFRYFSFEHPMEHDLLRSLGSAHEQTSQVLIILGATVAAPLFEELLFRGHLQTLLRRGFMLMTQAGPLEAASPPGAFMPVIGGAAADAPAPLDTPRFGTGTEMPPPPPGYIPPAALAADTPLPVSPLRLPMWPSWAAVLVTSVLFMLVHPSWSWPPIFLLSMGLGYLYERTGNLWAPISVHLLFNGLETLQYVLIMHAR